MLAILSEPMQAAHLGPHLACGIVDTITVSAAARVWLGVLDHRAATAAHLERLEQETWACG